MKTKQFSLESGCQVSFLWEGILTTMDNLFLFGAGMIVTLISGFGVIVYAMTPPSYEKPPKKPEPDIDLGSHDSEVKKVNSDL